MDLNPSVLPNLTSVINPPPFYLTLHKSINPPPFFRRLVVGQPPYPANITVVINTKLLSPFPKVFNNRPFTRSPRLALPLKKINSLPSIPSHHIQPPHHGPQTGRQKAEPSNDHDAELGRRAEWCALIGWGCRGRNECRSGYAGAGL
jgi:hypothetical protein